MNTDTGTFDQIPPEPKSPFQRIAVGEIVLLKGEQCEVVGFGETEAMSDGSIRHREITLRLLDKQERVGNRHERRAEAAQERSKR